MKKQLIDNLDFSNLLEDLGERAKNPVLLQGKNDGWQTTLAWNPCDKYTLDRGKPIQDNLYEFIDKHQKKQHLIVGFLNYDLGNYLYDIKPANQDGFDLPLITLFAYDNYLQKSSGKTYACYEKPDFSDLLKNLGKSTPQPAPKLDFKLAWSKQSYIESFEKVKNYIYDGVVYQINLTQKLEAVCEDSSRSIFGSLSAKNTSKMQGYFEADNFEIISLSPERFVKTTGRLIETTPIKGTRPRGNSHSQDKQNEQSLLNDEKEKAELNMITDLLRNDLGKVCQTGSIKVKKKRQLEKLPAVMHTFSQINGRLKAGVTPLEALLSMFPGGSITGCPKKKAMEIINDLEEYNRGAYCGSMFVIDADGNLDSSILIRTIVKKKNHAILPVGSGIVYDSTSENEYQENLDKANSVTRN